VEGHLTLSKKERQRLAKFEEVTAGRMTLKRAAELLSLSYRQVLRAYARFRAEGDRGLMHRRRRQASNRRTAEAVKAAVLTRYRERYEGFGPTLEFIAFGATGGAEKRGGRAETPPRRIAARVGARVALQRCPILRAGTCYCSIKPAVKVTFLTS